MAGFGGPESVDTGGVVAGFGAPGSVDTSCVAAGFGGHAGSAAALAHGDPRPPSDRRSLFPGGGGGLFDAAQRPSESPQRQNLLLFGVAQDVAHGGEQTCVSRRRQRLGCYVWWPVFTCPPVAGFGCPPRQQPWFDRIGLGDFIAPLKPSAEGPRGTPAADPMSWGSRILVKTRPIRSYVRNALSGRVNRSLCTKPLVRTSRARRNRGRGCLSVSCSYN